MQTKDKAIRSLKVQFSPTMMRSVLAHPGLRPGEGFNHRLGPVIEITDIPDDVDVTSAIRLWDLTADCTWLGKGPGSGRHSFSYNELSPGRLIFV